MFEYIKFIINIFQSSKYIRKGKCRQCGDCCRNIVFIINDKKIETEKQFVLLKKWNKQYGNFYISGKDIDGALLFTCKELGTDNKCKMYYFRSILCRMYPNPCGKFLAAGGKMQDNCGYWFEPNKKFETFLK